MKKAILFFIIILIFACGDKKKVLVEDNKTKNLPINPVIAVKKESISKGNQYFLNGQYEEALKFYEKGVKENRSVAYYNIGVSYYLLGNLKKSEEYFKLALQDEPNFKEAYLNLVAVLIQEGKVDEAEKYITFLEDYDDVKVFVNIANLYLKKGETAKSYYYFEKASEKDPDNEFVKASYGNFLISINQLDKGIEILESLKKKGYDEFFNLAKAYFYKKDYVKSVDYIKKAIEIKKTEQALNLLANDYQQIGDFILEASILAELIDIAGKPEYRFRYAIALYKSGDFSKAKEVVSALIKEYPKVAKYYKLKYDILINEREYKKALKVVKNAYIQLKTPFFRYLYVRHLLIYFNNVKKAYALIKNVRPIDDYDFLSRAIYYIKVGNFNLAKRNLDKVQVRESDFYMLKTYIALKERRYEDALENANRISKFDNRHYLYKFIALWNLGKIDELIDFSRVRLDYLKYNREYPKVSFRLKRNVYDIGFLYRYDGKFEDILRLFLFPLVVDPKESIEFLTLGYKLLQDNENLKAIIELKKSASFNNGIMYNNRGIESFLKFDYYGAIKYFKRALKYLKNNPFVSYNLGLSYLAIGDLKRAYFYFDNSVLNNKFLLFSYLGKAVVLYLRGEISRVSQYYDQVVNNFEQTAESVKYPHIFILAKYFAMIGLGKYDEVIYEVSNRNDELIYPQFLGKLAQFLSSREKDVLYDDDYKNIYHYKCFFSILDKDFAKSNDKVCNNYKDYLKLSLRKDTVFPINTKMDKYEVAQYVMYNMALKNYKEALKGLKILSRKSFKFGKLYEISLYYFLLNRDFINAEASYTALEKLKHKNLYTQFYRMIYFLMNYNGKRLVKEINGFIKDYPVDYRGLMVDTLYSFKTNNLKKILDDLLSVKNIEPNIDKKVSLEILIDDI